MTVYLICFRTPDGEKGAYKHAGHYLGFTDRESASSPQESVAQRLHEHRTGYGAALTRAAAQAGLVLVVSRIWPDAPQDVEWQLRCRHENNRLCPFCNPEAGHLALEV